MEGQLQATYKLPNIRHGLELTEDQGMIRDMVREFAQSEVAPLAAEIDEEHTFPVATWEKIVELGLPGIPFSEEYGGSDGGTLAYILAVEEISKVCASTGLTLAAHVSLGTYPIYAWGADALKLDGLSITHPLKHEALELAASALPGARVTEAANTLLRTPAGWQARNTDWKAACDCV